MPEMDGYELARSVREIEAAEGRTRVPIIACTANALRGESEKCFAAGMDDYLAKPVHLTELAAKLQQWLPLPRAESASGASSGAAGESDAAPTVDRSILAEISGGVAQDERSIFEEFRRINNEDAAALRRAVDDRNAQDITRTAHRMKGASKMVGAVRLAEVCARIERAGRTGDLDTVDAAMPALSQELERLTRYIDSPAVQQNQS